MEEPKNKQLYRELAEWLLKLETLKQQNAKLKNQLAQMIGGEVNTTELEKIEYLQNRLLNKDIVTDFLRQDIALQKAYLKKNEAEIDLYDQFQKRQQKLYSDIEKLESEFNYLKNELSRFSK